MKIEIDLSECPHNDLIRRWCSVSRTLNLAISVIDDLIPDGEIPHSAMVAMAELKEIGDMLDYLHKKVQNQLHATKTVTE
jgi:hypothetical protein